MEPIVLCGVQSIDFTAKDTGRQIKGTNVYWEVAIPERYGKGVRCEKAFIRPDMLKEDDFKKLVPGARIFIYWNQFGSVAGVEFAGEKIKQ